GTVMLAAWVGGPVTGASMNPARSLAPALFEGRLGSLWIYLAGPCLGAVAAALLYEAIRLEPAHSAATRSRR
ncbi:MAG TPA: aquaporin, partial [bacterium]|nr:aquaporin [bacterium]